MNYAVIFVLLVLCISAAHGQVMRLLNFRREINNYSFNGHSLGVPSPQLYGGKHKKHGLRRRLRHQGPENYGYGYAPDYGYGYEEDYYGYHNHHKAGKRLGRRHHKHGY